ncbi:MAG: hypothetical protein KKA81_12515, partial [Bacteroidetes bacterium]|nr:hypothetical protein [Bacteroidota bacterium]
MKKLNIIATFLLLLITGWGYSQGTWVGFTTDNPDIPEINVIEQNEAYMVVDVRIPGMFVNNVEKEGLTFQELRFHAWQTTQEIGKPALPLVHEIIGLPDEKLARVSLIE